MGIFDRVGNRAFSPLNGPVSAGGGSSSPLTTKGDVWGYSTVDARVPVGTNGQVLTADSTQALGIKWANVTATPAGSNTQLQFNNSGSLGADAKLSWNNTTKHLFVGTPTYDRGALNIYIADPPGGGVYWSMLTGAEFGWDTILNTGTGAYELRAVESGSPVGTWFSISRPTGALTLSAYGAGVATFNGSGVVASTSITTGSIPFGSSGGLAQDNANLFWDNSSKFLGVGTSSPAATLHLKGQTDVSVRYEANGDNYAYFIFNTDSVNRWEIGVTPPRDPLGAGYFYFSNSPLTGTAGAKMMFSPSGTVQLAAYGAGVATFNGSGDVSSTSITTGSIPFGSSGGLAQDNTNLFWDNSGKRLKVGIGVDGTMLEFGSGGFLSTFSASVNVGAGSYLTGGGSWIATQTAATTFFMFPDGTFQVATNTGLTPGNSYSPTLRFQVDPSGNVGIGAHSCTAQLDTDGTVRFRNFGAGFSKFDSSGNISSVLGASGTFTTVDSKTVTVVDGLITSIV